MAFGFGAYPHAESGEIGADIAHNAAHPVVGAGAAFFAETEAAKGDVEIIVENEYFFWRDFVEGHGGGDGFARQIHVGHGEYHQKGMLAQVATDCQAVRLVFSLGVLEAREEVFSGHKSNVVAGMGVFGAGIPEAYDEMKVCHTENYGMCGCKWSMIRGMNAQFQHYKSQFLTRLTRIRSSLPLMVTALLFLAFGLSLCLEYAVQWAMRGPLWHGAVVVGAAVLLVWGGQFLLQLFALSKRFSKPPEASPQSKEDKQNLAFPFDILAGHHCAVLVSFDDRPPKTYLIPNVVRIVPVNGAAVVPEAAVTQGLVEKTVGQLRHKGYPIQILKPEGKTIGGYSPLMGNPKRDAIRIQPFDMVFVNWN